MGPGITGLSSDEQSSNSNLLPTLSNTLVVELSNDGDVIAVGSSCHNIGDMENVGQVQLFELKAESWTPLGNPITGENESDFAGASISLSADGSIVAVGSPGYDGNGNASGQVRVFQYYNLYGWVQLGSVMNGMVSGELFGRSVSLSADGKVIAIGTLSTNESDSTSVVRVFKYLAGDWNELGSGIKGEDGSNIYAWSALISADGDTVVVSNHRIGNEASKRSNEDHSHFVKAFRFVSDSWTPYGNMVHSSIQGDSEGYVISVSDNGELICVGDPERNSVHLYTLNGKEWTQVGPDIIGEST
eukprot:3159959-Ditylum_brightwellii.AAC.1